MVKHECLPDVVYTSLLRRAIDTANIALDNCDRHWIPVKRAWQLNERHYGGLQGKNKAEAAEKFGEKQVHIWRRSYDVRPPELEEGGDTDPDGRYKRGGINVPKTECLKDVLERALPYWQSDIIPDLKAGKTVLIAAHGNSLRALMKDLEGISDEVSSHSPSRHLVEWILTSNRISPAWRSRPASRSSTSSTTT
jgi:2,3-bisphosphoglycerate-dependent phosphoglycerate mutase